MIDREEAPASSSGCFASAISIVCSGDLHSPNTTSDEVGSCDSFEAPAFPLDDDDNDEEEEEEDEEEPEADTEADADEEVVTDRTMSCMRPTNSSAVAMIGAPGWL
jgi:archaellum component FlaD/FlaE